jgi:hypothetical protein|tara:strand:- start:4304 stop:4474 length:171 start_codon:yes stop_codon:yes gene_type:complete
MAQAANKRRKIRKTCLFDPEVIEKLRGEMIIRLQRGERCTLSSLVNEKVRDSLNIL